MKLGIMLLLVVFSATMVRDRPHGQARPKAT